MVEKGNRGVDRPMLQKRKRKKWLSLPGFFPPSEFVAHRDAVRLIQGTEVRSINSRQHRKRYS